MWLSFIILGTIVSCLIWIIQRKRWSWILRFSIASGLIIILLAAIYIFHDEPDLVALGDEEAWYNKSPIFQTFIFFFMVIGMAARFVTNAIEERRVKIKKLRSEAEKEREQEVEIIKPKLEFDIWEFAYPFFFSVITFGLLLKQLDVPQVNVSNIIMSFQTGFIWQTLIKKEI